MIYKYAPATQNRSFVPDNNKIMRFSLQSKSSGTWVLGKNSSQRVTHPEDGAL